MPRAILKLLCQSIVLIIHALITHDIDPDLLDKYSSDIQYEYWLETGDDLYEPESF